MLSYHTISRNQLGSPVSSRGSSPDPELTERLRAHALDEFTFTAPAPEEQTNEPENDDDEAELVLFAAPASAAAPTTNKIRLQSPEVDGEPGFLVKRPRSYYFADELDSEREEEYKASALDAKTVRELAALPWPGCALPWKVTSLSANGLKKCVLAGHPRQLVDLEDKLKKRTRKGKKARIALRKTVRAREEKKAKEMESKKAKEEEEREKRTRRNREKKVKKKAREKAKKAAGGAEVEGGEGEEGTGQKMEVDDGSE